MANSTLNVTYRTKKDGRGTQQLQTEMTSLDKALKTSRLSLADVKAGADLLSSGFRLAQQFVRDTIGPTMELAEQQRDLARAMGAPAEEAGVLLQVADDLDVSFESLTTGMKRLNAEGIQPSWENIMALAQEYQDLPTSTAKALFAQQKFGRAAGPELQKLLEKSTTELERMAEGLEGSALIMSGEAVEAADELRLAQDGLNDAILEGKVAIGTEMVPALTDLTEITTDLVPWVQVLAKGFSGSIALYKDLGTMAKLAAIETALLAGAIDEEEAARERLRKTTGMLTDATDRVRQSNLELKPTLEDNSVQGRNLEGAMRGAATATDDLKAAQEDWANDAAQDAVGALRDAAIEGQNYVLALEAIDRVLGTGLANQDAAEKHLAAINEEFAKTGDVAAYEAAITRLYTQTMPGLGEKLDGVHEKSLGIAFAIGEIGRKMDELDGKTATITIKHVDEYISAGAGAKAPDNSTAGAGKEMHDGGTFIVPPGYPNDSFPMRVESGERVTVTPASQVNNFNFNNSFDGGAAVDQLVSMVLAKAGAQLRGALSSGMRLGTR